MLLSASSLASPILPWSCASGDVSLTVAADLSYAIAVAGAPWLEHGDIALHTGGDAGSWLSVAGGSLTPLAIHNHSGVDEGIGAWESLNISWAGAVPLDTQFVCWSSSDLVEWRAILPAGAPLGISPGPSTVSPSLYNFNTSHAASLHFPSFRLGPAAAASSLGHVQWAGEFAFHENNFGVSFEGFVGGELGGPVVLHEPTWERGSGSGGKPRAGVLGPLAGFKDSLTFIVPDVNDPSSDAWRLVFGPHSLFSTLPSGFSSRFGFVSPRLSPRVAPTLTSVYPGDTGLTAAVYAYGAILRAIACTKRFSPEADKGVSIISQWSDNGAAYDGDWWDVSGHRGTAGETFEALRRGFDDMNLSVGSLQLDPYWYSRGDPGNKDWLPSVSVFGPDGFEATIRAFNTTLYSFLWATKTNFPPLFTFSVSPVWENFMKGPFSRIAPSDAEAFYSFLMERCVAWGCIGFEIDFLDMQYLGFDDVHLTPLAFETFLRGLSSAGARYGVPVQLCMPLVSDVLASSCLNGVSNIRASSDDDLDYASAGRWRIGLTSLLHGALDIRPFMDAVWTTPTNPGYTYVQNATELGVAISALSTGPVGIGDVAGATNASLVRATCASNGVILKPSLPATPLDAFFLYNATGGSSLQAARAELWAAPSFVPFVSVTSQPGRGGLNRFLTKARGAPIAGTFVNVTSCPFFSVLSVDVPAFTLFPSDLTPSLTLCDSSTAYVGLPWAPGFAAMSARCADGAAALNCVRPFDATTGLDVTTGDAPIPAVKGGPHAFDIISLSPLFSSGWALLGEIAKFVRVSPVRVTAIAVASHSVTTWVEGAPNELVKLALLSPGDDAQLESARVRLVEIAFNAEGGTAVVVCSGAGSTAACNSTLVLTSSPS